MRTMITSLAKSTTLVAAFSATQLQADERLNEIINDEIEKAVVEYSAQYLLEFKQTSLNAMFEELDEAGRNDEYARDSAPWFKSQLLIQTADSLPRSSSIFTVELEACGPGTGPIPWDVDVPDLGAMIDRVRIATAFDSHNITFNIGDDVIGTLRDSEYNHSTSQELRPGLKALNNHLMSLHSQGRLSQIYQIVDYSEGCGAGEILVALETSSDVSSVWVIPDFYFRVCNRRYADPWSTNSCAFWDSAKEVNAFSGVYRWQATSNTSGKISGAFTVSDEMDQTIRIP